MSNPNSMSPRQMQVEAANKRLKEQHHKGEHPPVGNPWRALAYLNHREVLQWFLSPEWAAFKAGVQLEAECAKDVALDVTRDQSVRDEACGVVRACNSIIRLEDDLAALFKVVDSED